MWDEMSVNKSKKTYQSLCTHLYKACKKSKQEETGTTEVKEHGYKCCSGLYSKLPSLVCLNKIQDYESELNQFSLFNRCILWFTYHTSFEVLCM